MLFVQLCAENKHCSWRLGPGNGLPKNDPQSDIKHCFSCTFVLKISTVTRGLAPTIGFPRMTPKVASNISCHKTLHSTWAWSVEAWPGQLASKNIRPFGTKSRNLAERSHTEASRRSVAQKPRAEASAEASRRSLRRSLRRSRRRSLVQSI